MSSRACRGISLSKHLLPICFLSCFPLSAGVQIPPKKGNKLHFADWKQPKQVVGEKPVGSDRCRVSSEQLFRLTRKILSPGLILLLLILAGCASLNNVVGERPVDVAAARPLKPSTEIPDLKQYDAATVFPFVYTGQKPLHAEITQDFPIAIAKQALEYAKQHFCYHRYKRFYLVFR